MKRTIKSVLMRASVFWVLLALPVYVQAQSHYATNQAQEHYDEGINYERRAEQQDDLEFLHSAKKSYEAAIKADPNMQSAYARLGYVLYALQQSGEGITRMREGLARHVENVELQHYLGLNLFQHGDVDEAEAVLTQVVEKRKDFAEAYFVLGKIALDKGDYESAQEHFASYAAQTPNDIRAYRALSKVYIEARNVEGAESSLEQILKLDSKDFVATVNMGHVKFEKGEIDEAVKYYERAYEMNKKQVELIYIIGSAYYLSGQYDNAIKRFDELISLQSKHLGAAYFRADCYLKLGKLDEAHKAFTEILNEKPDYLYVKLKLAEIEHLRGNNSEAETRTRLLLNESSNVDDKHFAAVLLRRMGNIDESLNIHKDLVKADPKNERLSLYLARDYIEGRSYDEALLIISEVIDQHFSNELAWEMMSLALLYKGYDAMLSGDLVSARETFEQARSTEQHNVESLCSLSQIAMLEANFEGALDLYHEAVSIAEEHPSVLKLGSIFDLLMEDYGAAQRKLHVLQNLGDDKIIGAGGWYLMAIVNSHLGNWPLASEQLKKAEGMGFVDMAASAAIALQNAMDAAKAGKHDELDKELTKADMFKDMLEPIDRVRFNYLSVSSMVRQRKYSQAKSLLEDVKRSFNNLSAEQRGEVVEGGQLDVDYELAYINLESGSYDAALKIIASKRGGGEYKNLELALRRRLGADTFKNKRYSQASIHFNTAISLGGTETADAFNAAIADLMAGKLRDPENTLERYARQNIPEALLAYAIFLDNSGQTAKASGYFARYLNSTGGRKAEDVKKILQNKERVWGPSAN
ncbi:MAG: tetratricopeptide repeat protein [Bradymonadales bacterium]|jgi:tetratricopeptide (TPR) repeat protein